MFPQTYELTMELSQIGWGAKLVGLLCTGLCEKCPKGEEVQKYCLESGYRQLLNCSWDDPGNSTSHELIKTRRRGTPPKARSCEVDLVDTQDPASEAKMPLLSFEVLVVTVLFAAFVVMLWRKRQIPFP